MRNHNPVMFGKHQANVRRLALVAGVLGMLALYVVVFGSPFPSSPQSPLVYVPPSHHLRGPLSTIWGESTKDELQIAIVTDMDQMSKVKNSKKPAWRSVLKRGTVRRFKDGSELTYDIEWNANEHEIVGVLGEEGRGMEFSELVSFQGKLLTVDDRTGVVFEITKDMKAIPRHILMEGDGNQAKGQKNEWATVKDNKLYVGSFGKEYVNSDGTIKNRWNLWVSVIDGQTGGVTHEDWTHKYEVLRQATESSWPGYMIHEAIEFDQINRKWVVLPRRVSSLMYDEKTDELMGSNRVLVLDEDFKTVEQHFRMGPNIPLRGWSTFKFVPGTNNDVIVAVKTEEEENKQTGESQTRSFITVFRLSDQKELMPQTPIPGKYKFEGLEFL